ncbi:MAG TPA: AMP-binding protein [Pseudonocardiaceae bacterium]|jgi:acyl-CoA synthetase (AMP-forming)/AMP-acid ligase II
MSSPEHTSPAHAVATALVVLDIRPLDRVLVMLPDGSGLAEAFSGVIQHEAVPLPVNPLLSAHEVVAAAADAGAHLILIPADRIDELSGLDADLLVLPPGPSQTPWAAALRLR